jgi:Ca2+/Na+ antiporter
MMAFNFKKWNTLLGWISFCIALVTYSLTVEPTVSFWDCGEYISTSANLELGHPPGAPLFQMLGAFFAMFAMDNSQVALMVNMMSVISSAFTILLMFWSLTMLIGKMVVKSTSEITKSHQIMILGSAFVGAMSFTFSDTFWYNAVEAEVYAMATFLISLLLWLGLKWEENMDKERGDKWLLLIALVVGFSFGVHIMALLTIPSISLIYFFKKYKEISIQKFILFNVIAVVILFLVFSILIPFTLEFFGRAEIFLVNSFGLPFDSGTIIAFLSIIAVFYFSLNYTVKHQKKTANTLILCVMFILIGFSSWMMLPIRANANPPINENRPSDAVEMLNYYNREQYGSNSITFGRMYTEQFSGLDQDNPYFDAKPNYNRDEKSGKYIIVNQYKNAIQNLDDNHKGFLPRMWSPDHAQNYMQYADVPEFRINPDFAGEEGYDQLVAIVSDFRAAYNSGRIDEEDYLSFLKTYGNFLIVERPSLAQNISYMFSYQFNYMYWRYLMWNFAGRQNDVQGKGDVIDGNWLTGINSFDKLMLFSQDNLPSDVLNDKARNTYYLIPFLLGLFGLLYHSWKDSKNFYIIGILFLFTGLALKIYLNERPFEPRERDYAVVGSFYIFAMWIGFGVYGIFDLIRTKVQAKIAVPLVLSLSLLGAPILMASENWDDHDRSGKYTALANAKAYLDSCDPNAILFTIGDNDTFPLWYAQEIEKYRTDVRIVNTSLLMTDWYIDQMKSQAHESAPIPSSLDPKDYLADRLDYVFFDKRTENRWNIKDLIKHIKSDNPNTFVQMRNGESLPFYPTNKIRVPVDKNAVIKHKVVSEQFHDSIVPYIDIDIKGSSLYKNRIVMLDIIAENNWERPICFTGGSFGDEDYIWMKNYLQLDGMVYKLVPVYKSIPKNASPMDLGQIDEDKMYTIFKNLDWGNSNGNIYHDPETRKNSISYRTNGIRLIEKLIQEEKIDQAKEMIELINDKLPVEQYGYYSLVDPYVGAYYLVGEPEKARKLFHFIETKYKEHLNYFSQLKTSEQNVLAREIITYIERYRSLLDNLKAYDNDYFHKNKADFVNFNKRFERFGRNPLEE